MARINLSRRRHRDTPFGSPHFSLDWWQEGFRSADGVSGWVITLLLLWKGGGISSEWWTFHWSRGRKDGESSKSVKKGKNNFRFCFGRHDVDKNFVTRSTFHLKNILYYYLRSNTKIAKAQRQKIQKNWGCFTILLNSIKLIEFDQRKLFTITISAEATQNWTPCPLSLRHMMYIINYQYISSYWGMIEIGSFAVNMIKETLTILSP